MKKAPGRPKKIVKRELTTGIRFTRIEDTLIRQKAKTAGLSVTNYIRKMAIYGGVKARFTDEDRQLLRQFVGTSNILNELVKIAQQQGSLTAHTYFEIYRNQFDELINRLKRGQ